MKLFGTTASATVPLIVPAQFRDVLRRPTVAREFFLPVDRARWVGRRYTLGRWAARHGRLNARTVRELRKILDDTIARVEAVFEADRAR